MDWLSSMLWPHGKFLHIEWNTWKLIGWLGNLIFFSRILVQWYATEKKKQVVVPVTFWWLSLLGTLLLLTYALFYKKDSVFIFAYALAWIPYTRNLVLHHRHEAAQQTCPACGAIASPAARYCCMCGNPLAVRAGVEQK